MRVLVTGVSGFIGEHIAKHLLEQGHKVRGASRWLDFFFLKEEKYEHVTIQDPFSKKAWREITSEVNAVVHLIAKTHTQESGSLSDLSEYRHINVDITKALFEASWKAGVKRFVYMSSIKAVGEETAPGEAFAEDSPCHPAAPCGITKREAEETVLKYRGKMSTAILRAPLVYGPGVKGNFLRLMALAKKGIRLPIGGIDNQRSYLYVRNLADGLIQILQGDERSDGIFHVADRTPVSTPYLYSMLLKDFGKDSGLLNIPEGIVRRAAALAGKGPDFRKLAGSLVVSSQKFRKTFDWKEPFSFEEGLEKTCRWYKAGGYDQDEKRYGS